MKPELKHLEENESFYETEYLLRKDIHHRKGEILKLEHINAKHCREIERLNEYLNEKDRSVGKCLRRIDELLQDKARVEQILETTSDVSGENMFEYLKVLLINLSRKEGNAPIKPDDIDVKYIEAASRYCFPVLFDKYALLDEDDTNKIKIQFAEYILRMFGLENMYEYENLHTRGEIELEFIDHRSDADENAEDRHKIELADSVLHKFRIETMAKYEELIERGDIDIATIDYRGGLETRHVRDTGYNTVRKFR